MLTRKKKEQIKRGALITGVIGSGLTNIPAVANMQLLKPLFEAQVFGVSIPAIFGFTAVIAGVMIYLREL